MDATPRRFFSIPTEGPRIALQETPLWLALQPLRSNPLVGSSAPMTDRFDRAQRAAASGDFRQAEELYRQILQAETHGARAWFQLGQLCFATNRFPEAIANFRQAIACDADDPANYLHLGNALLQLSQYAEAEAAYRRCLELNPNRIEAMVNLGYALGEQEKYDEAIACYENTRRLAPDVPEVHHNLGNVLRERHRVEEALASYNEALRLRPDYSKAHINRGIALARLCQVDAAVESLRRGVELQPDFAEAHNSLGTALSSQGQLDEAEAAYARAIQLKPDYPDAYWNQSLVRLLRGDYERGWPEYEWRWQCKKRFALPALSEPRWDGSSLEGKTILLHAEQGLGDTLHFVRYAPRVKARGGRVILQCQGGLIPLLSRTPGIDGLVAWGAKPPPFDVWAPLMSLPAIFRTTLETIPSDIPYLFVDPNLFEHWERQLAAVSGFTVGIAWQGSPRHAWDRHRSAPLSAFEPLARIPGVRLVSLQKSSAEERARDEDPPFPLVRFGELLDSAGAFTDTAAIVQHLDLIVAVDTAVAHLAGGLGVPTWLAIHRTPDWRWMLERRDTPWYPNVRLFRQQTVGDWSPVFRQIAAELSQLVALHRRVRPLFVEVSAGEFFDKLSILRIKLEKISDKDKLGNVRNEVEALEKLHDRFETSPELERLQSNLRSVNETLWEIEDAIRLHEERQDFGESFIELARAVYRNNDRRATLKRAINELLKSRLVEEKSYAEKRTEPSGDAIA